MAHFNRQDTNDRHSGARKVSSSGFTLIELLVVVILLAVLSAIAVPVFASQKEKAEDSAAQSNIATISEVIANGFSIGSTPASSGGMVSYTSSVGDQDVALGGASAAITDSSDWCVEQEGGTGTFHMTQSTSTPQTGECPEALPGAPVLASVLRGDAEALATFTPASGGGITNYEYSTDGGASWTPFAPAITSGPVMITGLANGVATNVQLRAVNGTGGGTPSNTIAVTPTHIPPPPTNVQIVGNTITWDPPAWASNYKIVAYTTSYKRWVDRNDSGVGWGVYAQRVSPYLPTPAYSTVLNATVGNCGVDNTALGYTNCPLPRGLPTNAEAEGWAFRVFPRTASQLGTMSTAIQYHVP